MSTPARMVELECPRCQHRHWEIDCDYRGSALVGRRELSYVERTYECPACCEASTGYLVLQKAPPEFFLQPHPMYPMTTREFARWLDVFRAHFPNDDRLRELGVSWYPGEAGEEQELHLLTARRIATVGPYLLSLSNRNSNDERIGVYVQWFGVHAQGHCDAHFWCGSEVELDHCYFGYEPDELKRIQELLVTRTADIRHAWERFSTEAKAAQESWLSKVRWPPDS